MTENEGLLQLAKSIGGMEHWATTWLPGEYVEHIANGIVELQSERVLLVMHFCDFDAAEGHVGDEQNETPAESAIRVMCDRKAEIDRLKSQLAAVISERDGPRGYAETVAKLRTENEGLREALAPFAEAAQYMKAIDPEEAGVWTDSHDRCRVTVADFHKAAAALNPPAEGEGGGA